MIRRRAVLVAVLCAAVVLPAGVEAVPPGGPADDPGDPPASISIDTTRVPRHGVVRFTGSGFLTSAGAPQVVYVKLDDHGVNGIGPFVADASGALSGSVSLDHREAPAGIGDTSRGHWLRFLAGPSGRYPANGPARVIKGSFAVVPAPIDLAATTLRAGATKLMLALRAGSSKGSTGMLLVRGAGRRSVLARGSYRLRDAARRSVVLSLTSSGRRILGRGRRVPVRVTLSPVGGGTLTLPATAERLS
jgi:hypothetical protein